MLLFIQDPTIFTLLVYQVEGHRLRLYLRIKQWSSVGFTNELKRVFDLSVGGEDAIRCLILLHPGLKQCSVEH